jgi:hypothetical protein
MSTTTFLGIAEKRTDHLREVSRLVRSLEWDNASLPEVEAELPELELAIGVYERLTPVNGEGGPGWYEPEGKEGAFPVVAERRADSLRRLSHHMHELVWERASLTDVDAEITDLDVAMRVYRRLSTGTARDNGEAPETRATVPVPHASTDEHEAATPSFRDYALQHLDGAAPSAVEADAS